MILVIQRSLSSYSGHLWVINNRRCLFTCPAIPSAPVEEQFNYTSVIIVLALETTTKYTCFVAMNLIM